MPQLLFVFFIFACLFLPGKLLADDLTGNIQQHYAGMTSFKAEFAQTLTHRESGAVEKRQGTLTFAKPLRLLWQTSSPRKELLLITKDVIWNYIPDEEIAYQYNPNLMHGAANIIQVITGQADLMRDFEVKRVGLENNLQRLKLYPKNPTTQLVEADIWVDAKSGVIMKSESVDFYGNGNTIAFTSYTENVQIKDSLFRFSPPKGVEVEDRRNDSQGKDLLR